MYRFIISSESLIFIPQRKGAVKPSDCEGLNLRVPLNLRDLGLAALDLEVGYDNPFLADKYDSRQVSCDCEDNVEVIVRPWWKKSLLIFQKDMLVEKHRHFEKISFKFKL